MLEQGLILIGQILLIIIILSLYFAPTIYAYYWKSDRIVIHFIANTVSGWSIVGWVIMWIVVLMDDTMKPQQEGHKTREQHSREEFEKEREARYTIDPEGAKLRDQILQYMYEMDAKTKQRQKT